MPGIFFRALSVIALVHFIANPAGGDPPAPADALKKQPPKREEGSSNEEILKGLRQRLNRKRDLEKERTMTTIAPESLLVPRSSQDNMPIVNPGAGFAFNMPIARPDPNIDYKLRLLKTPAVPYVIESIRPESRKFKPKKPF